MINELYEESMESFKYSSDSKLKTLLLSISEDCLKVYENIAIPENRLDTLRDVLENGSHKLRAYTNLSLILEIDPDRKSYNVDVEIPKIGYTYSPIYGKLSDSEMERVLKGEKERTVSATIDYQNSKVSGYFSTIDFTISLGEDIFKPNLLTKEELSAVLLHEIGHIFDFLDTLGEIDRTIGIASYTKKTLEGNYSIEKKLDLIKILDPEMAKSVTDPGDIDDEEIITLVLTNGMKNGKSRSGTKVYDRLATEFIADGFATSHGAGYDLLNAMSKLDKEKFFLFRDKQYRPKWTGLLAVISEAFETQGMIRSIMAGGSLHAFYYLLLIPILINVIPYTGNNLKLTPEARVKKVREQMISALKSNETSKKDKDKLLKDLESLDNYQKKLTVGPFTVTEIVKEMFTDIFLTRDRRHHKTRMNLDSLDNNKLFVISEKLRRLK